MPCKTLSTVKETSPDNVSEMKSIQKQRRPFFDSKTKFFQEVKKSLVVM